MGRKEVFDSITSIMRDYCEGTGYKLIPIGELPYDEHWNKVQYQINLSGGVFVINLMGNRNTFKYIYDDSYPKGKSTMDNQEILTASQYFDSKINTEQMIDLFSRL